MVHLKFLGLTGAKIVTKGRGRCSKADEYSPLSVYKITDVIG